MGREIGTSWWVEEAVLSRWLCWYFDFALLCFAGVLGILGRGFCWERPRGFGGSWFVCLFPRSFNEPVEASGASSASQSSLPARMRDAEQVGDQDVGQEEG